MKTYLTRLQKTLVAAQIAVVMMIGFASSAHAHSGHHHKKKHHHSHHHGHSHNHGHSHHHKPKRQSTIVISGAHHHTQWYFSSDNYCPTHNSWHVHYNHSANRQVVDKWYELIDGRCYKVKEYNDGSEKRKRVKYHKCL